MENMAILNTTALDFVEDYNRVDIWKKRLCWVGWFMNNSPALLCVTSMRSRVPYDSRPTDWIKPP